MFPCLAVICAELGRVREARRAIARCRSDVGPLVVAAVHAGAGTAIEPLYRRGYQRLGLVR